MPLSKVGPFLKWGVATLVIFLLVLSLQRLQRPALPNVIVFSVDTLRADHLSCYGYPRKTSPQVDRFAKDSVLFEKAVSQSHLTTPAFMSVFTGLTPWVHRLIANAGRDGQKIAYARLDEKIQTLPLVLRGRGYQTLGLHGGGGVEGRLGFDKGFDLYRYWGINETGISDIRDVIMRSKGAGRPFFLFLHNYNCHAPYLHAPPEFNLKFLTQRVPGLPVSRFELPVNGEHGDYYKAFWKDVDLRDPKHRDHIVSLYDGEISFEDHIFGEMVEILKKTGLYDRSLIIFVSDHGEEFFEHGGREHLRMFAETLNVPLIIKFPGNRFAGRSVRETVRTMDLMPTLLEFLKIKHESAGPMQGVSFASLVTGRGTYQPLVVSYGGEGQIRYVKDDLVYSNQHTDNVTEWLFDAMKDPREQNNLVLNRRDAVLRMRSMLEEIKNSNEAVRRTMGTQAAELVEDDDLSVQLRSLGYLG